MELAKKLQIPPGVSLFLVNAPAGLKLDVPLAKSEADGAVFVFVSDSKALKADARPAIEAAKADRLSWIAYPKAGQLGTDLNRDRLWRLMKPFGIGAVRAVSIDDTWSALRFRPSRPRGS